MQPSSLLSNLEGTYTPPASFAAKIAPALNQVQAGTPITSTPASAPTTTSTSQPAATQTGLTAAQTAAASAAALQAKISNLVAYGTNAAQQAESASVAGGASGLTSAGEADVNGPNGVNNTQNAINLARTQIGTTQINSIKQLTNTIRNGLQGTGVQLGNSGALSSSAADAAARAYADYGNQQTNAANNTAATANQAQDVQQTNLMNVIGSDKKTLDAARDAAIQAVQSQVASQLDSLATQITYLGGDPSSVNVQALQNQIVSGAQNDLAQIDQNYQNLLNGVNPATADQTAQSAEAASNAGVVPASQTPYSPVPTAAPSGIQSAGGAPPPSLIPLTLGNSGSNKTQTPGA